jgi:hypothetical protein
MAVELTTKRIELAKDMIKDLSRVALLVNTADEIGSRAYIAEGDAAGPRLGWPLCRLEYGTPMTWKVRFQRSVQSTSKQ